LNGAAARLVQVGDNVIIIAYQLVAEEKLADHQPKIVFMGPGNEMVDFATVEQERTVY